ncbi:unnamed protein product [Cyprideis torosa]|uniref:Uncharacterized protein n=1 Tax=Cyprideis torosa TaxID=163714 RepID=A0A7R8W6R5_9CRUS|nr:unnamed protein product [Cyprideis torosa]CAG0884338.1 unnamed protein product [Cyprideis torosa]
MMFSDQPPQLDPPTPLADGTFGLDEDSFHEWLPSSGVLIGDGTDANDQGVTVFAWPTSQVKGGPGEGLARFLIKFRHPTMPKYISRWKWQGNHCLATVPITPLSELDCDAIPLLLKLAGAHSLLEALDFLHSRANVSPGPLSSVNVFIGRDGAWKLCSTREREADETNRRNDLRTLAQVLEDAAILGDSVADVEAVLPGVSDFLDALKSLSVPSARQLLSHPVFNHPFVETLNFLHQLPLKTEEETDNFFRSLIVRLSDVPESVIAVLLSESLLSRLVLLNDTARREFLPSFLSPKANQLPANSEGVTSDENVRPVLSTPLFLSHVLPRVQRILGIRDKPIRLAILENLHRFMSVVPRDLLRNDFLPHVLLGLQDSDDSLVSATLRTLSQLVPILGAAAVVGPRSRPIFFDGRPKVPLPSLCFSQSLANEARTGSDYIFSEEKESKVPLNLDSSLDFSVVLLAVIESGWGAVPLWYRIDWLGGRSMRPVRQLLGGSCSAVRHVALGLQSMSVQGAVRGRRKEEDIPSVLMAPKLSSISPADSLGRAAERIQKGKGLKSLAALIFQLWIGTHEDVGRIRGTKDQSGASSNFYEDESVRFSTTSLIPTLYDTTRRGGFVVCGTFQCVPLTASEGGTAIMCREDYTV